MALRQDHRHGARDALRLCCGECGRAAPVELACIVPGILDILRAHRHAGDVHGGEPSFCGNAQGALDGHGITDDAHRIICLRLAHFIETAPQRRAVDENRRRVDAADEFHGSEVFAAPVRGVANDVDCRRLVVRDFRRPQEGCFRSVPAGHLGNLLIIRRDYYMVEQP